MRGQDQIQNVLRMLRDKRDTRQAVIQIFDAIDIVNEHKDVPCTCTLQFFLRDGRLDLLTYMRSNDVFMGLPHDAFAFTMLQEVIAASLGVELGVYKHALGSLHLYDRNREQAQQYLEEGWQSTMPMLPMPRCDPWPSIATLLEIESRTRGGSDTPAILGLEPYWADLARLLQIWRCVKTRNFAEIKRIRYQMSSDVYDIFIRKREVEKRTEVVKARQNGQAERPSLR